MSTNEPFYILVVEDEEAHAELIRRSFEMEDDPPELLVAGTLADARAAIDDRKPGIALVDMQLPDGRGLEMLPGSTEAAEFPVVIMTSHGNEEVAVEAMKKGALQYVVKSASNLADIPNQIEAAQRQWDHIVKRREAEAALQAREEHYRSLIENAQDIITLIDDAGEIEYVSPAIRRILGENPEDREGCTFLDAIHPDDRDRVGKKLEAVRTNPDAIEYLTYRERHKEGSWHLLEAIVSSQLRDDETRRRVINSRDVTDRRKAEEAKRQLEIQLRHAQRWQMIGQLAGDVASEISEMLAHILGFATKALRETPAGSPSAVEIEKLLAASGRSQDLAEQILLFTRHGDLERRPMELQPVVHEGLDLMRAQLPESVKIQESLDPACEQVVADSTQIHQVLKNLCTNAVYALSEGGGLIEVSLDPFERRAAALEGEDAEIERYVRLVVKDNGSGMDDLVLSQALEPFFTTRPAGQGTGLGLSVAQGIIVSHGGELDLQSTLGDGTTVTVLLPVADEAALAEAREASQNDE